MNQNFGAWEHLENLSWHDVLVVLAILVLARLLIMGCTGNFKNWRRA
jgi:hypothetical protein